jgi:hypothetical protein
MLYGLKTFNDNLTPIQVENYFQLHELEGEKADIFKK